MTTGATGSAQYGLHMTMGIAGNAGGATSAYVGMSGRLAALGGTSGAGASTNLSLPSAPNTSSSATSPLATSFASSRPSSSSAPSHDPLDFLHSSDSASNVLNFQTQDPTVNRTLFVGNVRLRPCFIFHSVYFTDISPSTYIASFSHPMARPQGSFPKSGVHTSR